MGFRSQRDCCSIPSAARVLQVPEASKVEELTTLIMKCEWHSKS